MACAESVVNGFVASQKTRQSSVLFDRMQLVAPSGQYLVGISLMADVPDELVIRRVKHIMHRHRQLNGTEACTCVTADTRTRVDNKLPHLVRDLLQILDTQLPQISGRINFR